MTQTQVMAGRGGSLQIVVSRDVDAPRERVWRAWTEADQVARWWGPEGFTTRVEELDLRVNGVCRYVTTAPDGTECAALGRYREIVAPERLVVSVESGGEILNGVVAAVLLADHGRRTGLTLRLQHATAEDARKHRELGVVEAWNSAFDCLQAYLAKISVA